MGDALRDNIGLTREQAKKYFSTSSGMNYTIKRTAQLQRAYDKPAEFLGERLAALTAAAASADAAFADMYEKLIKEKAAPADAHDRASRYATTIKDFLENEINESHPQDINVLSSKLVYAGSTQRAAVGFPEEAPTPAAAPVAAVAAPAPAAATQRRTRARGIRMRK